MIGPRVRSVWMKTNMEPEVSTEQRGRNIAIETVGGSMGRPTVAETPPPPPELPPPNVQRWTIRRKAAVVIAVANGALTSEGACRRYQLSEEEFQSWQRAYEAHGLAGLRSTRLQQYRDRPPRR